MDYQAFVDSVGTGNPELDSYFRKVLGSGQQFPQQGQNLANKANQLRIRDWAGANVGARNKALKNEYAIRQFYNDVDPQMPLRHEQVMQGARWQTKNNNPMTNGHVGDYGRPQVESGFGPNRPVLPGRTGAGQMINRLAGPMGRLPALGAIGVAPAINDAYRSMQDNMQDNPNNFANRYNMMRWMMQENPNGPAAGAAMYQDEAARRGW